MDSEKLAALIAAIAALQPEGFTKAGTPKTEALTAALGFPVTAAERDEAWAEVEKQKAAATPPPNSSQGAPPDAEKEKSAPAEKAVATAFDKTGATSVVTHRDGLKRIWFRDGKEIGVEDVG